MAVEFDGAQWVEWGVLYTNRSNQQVFQKARDERHAQTLASVEYHGSKGATLKKRTVTATAWEDADEVPV